MKQLQTCRGAIMVSDEIFTKGDAVRNGFSYSFTARDYEGVYLGEIYGKSTDMYHHNFILVRDYLDKDDVPIEVREHICQYLTESNLGELVHVQRKSNHPVDDYYLYSVIAKKGDTYRCWTSWNEKSRCLNHGSYGISSLQDCKAILKECYNDCRL